MAAGGTEHEPPASRPWDPGHGDPVARASRSGRTSAFVQVKSQGADRLLRPPYRRIGRPPRAPGGGPLLAEPESSAWRLAHHGAKAHCHRVGSRGPAAARMGEAESAGGCARLLPGSWEGLVRSRLEEALSRRPGAPESRPGGVHPGSRPLLREAGSPRILYVMLRPRHPGPGLDRWAPTNRIRTSSPSDLFP